MSYIELFFGKQLEFLTINDIESYFGNQQEESDKIEFKSYHSIEDRNHGEKENGIIRTICAMLNSVGGLIIWGAPVGQIIDGKKEKVFQGELSLVTQKVEKDRFINRVSDLITPSPSIVRIKELEKENSYVYIIEVEQSAYSPHQYRNNYFMRIDGQSKPAPHHYIESLFRKITFPRLEGYVKIENLITDDPRNYVLRLTILIFNWSKLQNEHDVYFRLIIVPGIFEAYNGPAVEKGGIYMDGHELRVHKAKPTLYYNEPLSRTEIITIRRGLLIDSNYEVNIMLYFAGKSCPLMLSEYILKLDRNIYPNINNLIVSKSENKFVYESGELELSEKEKVSQILDR